MVGFRRGGPHPERHRRGARPRQAGVARRGQRVRHALKPGDYEFYDFQFFWNGYNGGYSSIRAREQFLVPMHLEAGKAYYIGEFRSRCLGLSACLFFHGDQQPRDEVIARRYTPGLPPCRP